MFTRDRSWEQGETSTGTVVPFRARTKDRAVLLAARRDDDAPAAGAGGLRTPFLDESQLRAIESAHPDGLTAVQVVDAFTSRGVALSEASFRKYVQQNLLPRSRRVGRKGKHKGSLGVYPPKTVRRINDVKRWMADGFTIEQIQEQFLLYTDLIEGVAENTAELLSRIERDAERLEPAARTKLMKELAEARRDGDRLVERLEDIARRVAAPRTDNLRLAGAAGGAEDLL